MPTVSRLASGSVRGYGRTGKKTRFDFGTTISANTTNYNLKSAAIAAGWDQVLALNAVVTIDTGVYVGSTANNTYAFDTGASFPAGTSLAIINNGFIVGCGGTGGNGGNTLFAGSGGDGSAGTAGGPALRVQAACSITNNGTIGGGGGGGGGGAATVIFDGTYNGCTGGGGGGGRGYNGGVNGSPGSDGNTQTPKASYIGSFGTAGSQTAFGPGGAGGIKTGTGNAGRGGNGGDLGANGAGGGGASTGSSGFGGPAGSAGAAVSGNGNITWVVTGTRLGAIA